MKEAKEELDKRGEGRRSQGECRQRKKNDPWRCGGEGREDVERRKESDLITGLRSAPFCAVGGSHISPKRNLVPVSDFPQAGRVQPGDSDTGTFIGSK